MLGKTISIDNNKIIVKLEINVYETNNLMGKNVVFEDNSTTVIGEIISVNNNVMTVSLLGELRDNKFVYGDITKPSFNSKCRLITNKELDVIFNNNAVNNMVIGKSFIYNDYDIKLDINTFFSNHFAILGNTGSGKSYSVAKIIQSIFYDYKYLPFRTNIFLFDAYGEYQQAFSRIGETNENINYKVYTTDLKSKKYDLLQIPFWLLTLDDICLLLNVDNPLQIPIIEKSLKLVNYFARNDEEALKQKNDIIARCLLDIIYSGSKPIEIRNKIVSTLTKFYTPNLYLDMKLTKGGWTRTLRQCIYIEASGKLADIEIVISYLESLTSNNFELSMPNGEVKYTINDFYNALEFAIISEGAINSNNIFEYSNTLRIRLNSLINSDYVNYFNFNDYINKENYIKWLLTTKNGKKAQVINFNINYVDDRLAKTLVKIYSKLLFDYITKLNKRASFPFHIVLEEAHRYVQNDNDINILGYNIFERITKEGRKYGILLGLISQRPSEISQTALSQCSNFLIFKMFHPADLNIVKDIIASSSDTLSDKLKTLHPGTCIMFGNAFKMPIIAKLDMPNPEPLSSNCNINETWYIKN